MLVDIANRLKAGGYVDVAEAFCRQAASASDESLPNVLTLVTGLLNGSERLATKAIIDAPQPTSTGITFGELARQWTGNELAKRYRRRVKMLDHTENVLRFDKHILPIVFQGRTIGDTPLSEFTLAHAEHVLQQQTLPDGSLRHVAQCMNRVLRLAVNPAKILQHSPLQPGWLPAANPVKARSYLFPVEEGALMKNRQMPLVRRIFLGFCAREGPRVTNVVNLKWSDLTLEMDGGSGHAVIDRAKNGESVTWALDPGTAEALRRWRSICPSKVWVFPAEAVPRYRRRNAGKPMPVGSIAVLLRKALKEAGVGRAQLFEQSDTRIRLRAHDLRATFITLALRNGRTEEWVRTRTGHKTSQMIARYRREAETANELGLGALLPLHEAIPELMAIGRSNVSSTIELSPNCRPHAVYVQSPGSALLN